MKRDGVNRRVRLTNLLLKFLRGRGSDVREVKSVMQCLGITEEAVLKAFLAYNSDVLETSDNAVYEDAAHRIVLDIHNRLRGSWHERRQKLVWQWLCRLRSGSIADLGFGTPQLYVRRAHASGYIKEIYLCDKFDAAFRVAEVIMTKWDVSGANVVKFRRFDFDQTFTLPQVDTLLLQDSIEHALDPGTVLRSIVKGVERGTRFIFTLPIGPQCRFHNIEWRSDEAASLWLEAAGLRMFSLEQITMNPHVDFFAETLAGFHELLAVCVK